MHEGVAAWKLARLECHFRQIASGKHDSAPADALYEVTSGLSGTIGRESLALTRAHDHTGLRNETNHSRGKVPK